MVLYASHDPIVTRASLPSAIVSFVASIAILVLSYIEHMRSIKPSFLLNIYLLLSALFDAVQVRTLFLLHDNTSTVAVFTTALGVKIVLLLLEARAKRSYLKTPYASLSVECTIGIFNLSFFWWLNETFARGFRTLLTFNDLEKIDADLASETLGAALQKSWDTRCKIFLETLLGEL